MEFTNNKVTSFGAFALQETFESSKMLIIHLIIYLAVHQFVQQAKIQLPERKIASIKNHFYVFLYALIVVICLTGEFIFDSFTPFKVLLRRFIISYHFFHLLELKYNGMLCRTYIYHHLAALLVFYYEIFLGVRPFLLRVGYVLLEFNSMLYEGRVIMNILEKQRIRFFHILSIVYAVSFILFRVTAWPVIVIVCTTGGYPLACSLVCLALWPWYLFLMKKESLPLLKRYIFGSQKKPTKAFEKQKNE